MLSVVLSSAHESTLQWASSANAERYNVKRAAASGGPYSIVASGAFTTFIDRELAANTDVLLYRQRRRQGRRERQQRRTISEHEAVITARGERPGKETRRSV